MKLVALLAAFLTGTILGFALAAWSLYEPLPVGPAKYTFTRSAPPSTSLRHGRHAQALSDRVHQRIDQGLPAAVPEPGTLWLVGVGLLALGWKNRNRWKRHG